MYWRVGLWCAGQKVLDGLVSKWLYRARRSHSRGLLSSFVVADRSSVFGVYFCALFGQDHLLRPGFDGSLGLLGQLLLWLYLKSRCFS